MRMRRRKVPSFAKPVAGMQPDVKRATGGLDWGGGLPYLSILSASCEQVKAGVCKEGEPVLVSRCRPFPFFGKGKGRQRETKPVWGSCSPGGRGFWSIHGLIRCC